MRLICPNCGAQYEVDDGMIPPDGRDVQCSNCATTWFQVGARKRPAPVQPAPATPDADLQTPPAPTRAVRRPADETLDVLRQEAAFEARMRDAETIETQDELGLDAPEDAAIARGREARARIATLRRPEEGADPSDDADTILIPDPAAPAVRRASLPDPDDLDPPVPVAPPAARPGGSRRDLLPDIEEINSTLRPDEMGGNADDIDMDAEDAAAMAQRRKAGQRLGFGVVALFATAALLSYVSAPQLAERFPQAAPHLVAYVEWVNGARNALNAGVERLVEQITSLAQ